MSQIDIIVRGDGHAAYGIAESISNHFALVRRIALMSDTPMLLNPGVETPVYLTLESKTDALADKSVIPADKAAADRVRAAVEEMTAALQEAQEQGIRVERNGAPLPPAFADFGRSLTFTKTVTL